MQSDEQFIEKSRRSAYVGIIPAAGIGSRLPGRKLSKEILPVSTAQGVQTPVIAYLLSCMLRAGVAEISVVFREEKQDIAEYLGGDEWNQIQFHNWSTTGTSGVPETVVVGLQGLDDRRIAFGFPDILFDPDDAFTTLMAELDRSEADVVLGLFPTNSPNKMDMVDIDQNGQVINIEIKPAHTELTQTWILAVWRPSFSAYLRQFVAHAPGSYAGKTGDAHLGQTFQQAIVDGLQIGSVSFRSGRSLDIGTPDDLELAQSWFA